MIMKIVGRSKTQKTTKKRTIRFLVFRRVNTESERVRRSKMTNSDNPNSKLFLSISCFLDGEQNLAIVIALQGKLPQPKTIYVSFHLIRIW